MTYDSLRRRKNSSAHEMRSLNSQAAERRNNLTQRFRAGLACKNGIKPRRDGARSQSREQRCGRAPLERRVKERADVEERPFRAASEARKKRTKSRRDERKQLPHQKSVEQPKAESRKPKAESRKLSTEY